LAHQNYVLEEGEEQIQTEEQQIPTEDTTEQVQAGTEPSYTSEEQVEEIASVDTSKYLELQTKIKEQAIELENLRKSEQTSQQLLRKSLLTLRGQLTQIKTQHAHMQKQSVNALTETKDSLLESLSTRKFYLTIILILKKSIPR
jgi:hypothetical protein